MSEQTPEAAATEAEGETQQEQKPSETVEFWKQKAREQEKRAKENSSAASRLAEIEEAQKSESEKNAERIAKAEAEVSSIPSKVSEALRTHLVTLHEIDAEDAELFLTASDPDLLLKQVTRLLGQAETRKKNGNHVPTEGKHSPAAPDDERAATRALFSGD